MPPHLVGLQCYPYLDGGWGHGPGQNRHRACAERENHPRRRAHHCPAEMQGLCEQGILIIAVKGTCGGLCTVALYTAPDQTSGTLAGEPGVFLEERRAVLGQ